MTQGRLKHFGWGREGEGLTAEEERATLDRYRGLFGVSDFVEYLDRCGGLRRLQELRREEWLL